MLCYVLVFWSAKKGKKVWKVAPLFFFFGPHGGKELGELFEDKESLDQTIKSYFLCLFWDWYSMYMGMMAFL